MTEPTSFPTLDQACEFYGNILTDDYRRSYINFLICKCGTSFADQVLSKANKK